MASSHVSGARSDRDRSRSPSAGRTALTAAESRQLHSIPAIQSYVNDLLERTAALEHGLRMVRSKQEDEDDSFREELQELVDTVDQVKTRAQTLSSLADALQQRVTVLERQMGEVWRVLDASRAPGDPGKPP